MHVNGSHFLLSRRSERLSRRLVYLQIVVFTADEYENFCIAGLNHQAAYDAVENLKKYKIKHIP